MTDSNPFGALNNDEDTYDTFQQGEQKDATVKFNSHDLVERNAD